MKCFSCYLLSSLFLLFASVAQLSGQESTHDEVRANFEKLESAIQIVLRYSPRDEDMTLELVDDQKAQLEKLDEEYQQMIDEVQSLGDSPKSQKAKMAVFATKMATLTDTLHDQILLPHQSQVLDSMVFTRFVEHRNGSFLNAIESYYKKQFGLSNEQKTDLEAIEKETAKKIAELKKRYLAELEELKAEAKDEVASVLTIKQKDLFEKLTSK